MRRAALQIAWQSVAVVLVSAALAIVTDVARSDGIPLVTDVEYDIFALCADSEMEAVAASASDLRRAEGAVLYVDARSVEEFEIEHAAGALSAPYSVLFGASPEAIAAIKAEVAKRGVREIVVYGGIADPSPGADAVDVAKPLAEQLLESGLVGVKHLAGGLDALKRSGVPFIQETGGAR